MNDKIEKKVIELPPFKKICMTIGELPTSYLETMTYYEMLVWFTKYLGETIIPTVNNNAEAVAELQELFIKLQEYVNNYFDNLDVQEEINNKLDEMAESGELQRIIFDRMQYTTYEMFGAVLDGETDDTDAVINAHNYANEHNLKVVQKRGILYMPTANINNCPIINTDCDFTGLTLKCDDNNDNNTIMIIADPNTLETDKSINYINLSSAQISALSKTNYNPISFLNDYKNNYVVFDTDLKIGKRRFAGQEDVYYSQGFEVNDNSQLVPNNMYCDIASNSEAVTMRYLPLSQSPIQIKFPKIIIGNTIVNNPRILIERNNVNISDGIIVKEPSIIATSYSQALIDCRYCANLKINNFVGENISIEPISTDTTSYNIRVDKCYNVIFENNNLIKGHGNFVSYHTNFINFINNTTDRFDNHYGLFGGINVTNNNFISRSSSVNIGYGNGQINITNNTFNKAPENEIYSQYCVDCRTDLTVMYAGKINVENNTIYALNSDNSKYATLFSYIPSHGDNSIYPTFADYHYPEIILKNNLITGNTLKRSVEMYNNNSSDKTYILSPIIISNNNKNANNSILQIPGVSVPDGVTITLNNERANINDGDSALVFILQDTNRIGFTASKSFVQVTGRNNYVTGTIKNLKNYGACETPSGNLICNTLYNYGLLDYSNLEFDTGYISSYLKAKNLTVNTEAHITGCYVYIDTSITNSGTIYISGCQMDSTTAGRFDNGTISGNGNWGGTNSSNINTLI